MMDAVQAKNHALAGLRFVPRRRPRGHRDGMAGRHRSHAGTDFVQYRGYEQGDDPRLIDWKLWARSDRLFVRDTEAESQLRVWFWLDDTTAMDVRDEAVAHTRWQMALSATQTLMNVAEQGRDAYGLFGASVPVLGHGFAHAEAIKHQLSLWGANRPSIPATTLAGIQQHTQAGDVLVMISDVFSMPSVMLAVQAAELGLDVRVLQLVCSQEADLPSGSTFMAASADASPNKQRMVDPKRMKRGYQTALAEHQQQIRQRLQQVGASLATWVLSDESWSAHQAVLQPETHAAVFPSPATPTRLEQR